MRSAATYPVMRSSIGTLWPAEADSIRRPLESLLLKLAVNACGPPFGRGEHPFMQSCFISFIVFGPRSKQDNKAQKLD